MALRLIYLSLFITMITVFLNFKLMNWLRLIPRFLKSMGVGFTKDCSIRSVSSFKDWSAILFCFLNSTVIHNSPFKSAIA